MIDKRIVKRYAAALFNSASDADAVDMVESDLGLVNYTFESNPALTEAIESPLIPADKKREIVTSIFGGKIHEVTLFYLYLLIDNRREEVIADTEREYIALANEARGIVSAQVTSAVELTEDKFARLKSRFFELTSKRATVDLRIDPSIIGGLVVRIGDRVIDGSAKGHLEKMRDEFLS